MAGLASMIFGGGGNSQPYVPVAPPPTPTPTATTDPSVGMAAETARRNAVGGLASTVRTSAAGAAPAMLGGGKSLLGA